MRFTLDENVPASVAELLARLGHEAEFIRDFVPPGSPDPLVATIAQDLDAILISFDSDFAKIAPRVPDGQKNRFRRLNRIAMKCNEPQAALRLENALELIEYEIGLAKSTKRGNAIIHIGNSYIRTER